MTAETTHAPCDSRGCNYRGLVSYFDGQWLCPSHHNLFIKTERLRSARNRLDNINATIGRAEDQIQTLTTSLPQAEQDLAKAEAEHSQALTFSTLSETNNG